MDSILQEKLDICHWLYSIKSIPPSAYYEDRHNTHGCFLLDKDYVEAELSHMLNTKDPTIHPWYSLEYLQELMRKVDIHVPQADTTRAKTRYCTWDGYGYILRSSTGEVVHSEPVASDYHLSALRFLFAVFVKYR